MPKAIVACIISQSVPWDLPQEKEPCPTVAGRRMKSWCRQHQTLHTRGQYLDESDDSGRYSGT